jgi:D-sedoheptulose 7-phosphate isomerase
MQEMQNMQEIIRNRFDESLSVVRRTGDRLIPQIETAVKMIIDSYKAGGGLCAFGNGGSAADAQHIVAELVGRFLLDRKPLRAQALTTDTSILTSVANDYDFDTIFSRQVEAFARPGDIALGITTSGDSGNVLAGLQIARQIGMKTIALTGPGGGKCAEFADILLDAGDQGDPTARVQEAHMVIYHILCELVEAATAQA